MDYTATVVGSSVLLHGASVLATSPLSKAFFVTGLQPARPAQARADTVWVDGLM